ncbi:hypothetical protein PA0181 [Candidatus Phytoplasma australiense]|uniref:Uncharacterized protein n=1 Tax=Phytoplasma australiense TaxID=59748 RepID=B1V984_PHYAS|nr:hypothetical protein PA0181 [Candidatus Phytoplasma australiense]
MELSIIFLVFKNIFEIKKVLKTSSPHDDKHLGINFCFSSLEKYFFYANTLTIVEHSQNENYVFSF